MYGTSFAKCRSVDSTLKALLLSVAFSILLLFNDITLFYKKDLFQLPETSYLYVVSHYVLRSNEFLSLRNSPLFSSLLSFSYRYLDMIVLEDLLTMKSLCFDIK